MQCSQNQQHQSQGHDQGLLFKDQDKDKDFSSKDKDKDCILVLKESLRTRTMTRTNITGLWQYQEHGSSNTSAVSFFLTCFHYVHVIVSTWSDLYFDGLQRVVKAFPIIPDYTVSEWLHYAVQVLAVQVACMARRVPPSSFKYTCTRCTWNLVIVLISSAEHHSFVHCQRITFTQIQSLYFNNIRDKPLIQFQKCTE